MPSVADSAVVLMRLDYSETSQIIVFFTREHGKVRAIAKGVKRGSKSRFAVGVDMLDIGRIVISGRHDGPGLATLTEWKPTRTLFGLREKLARIQAAEYVAEITSHLTEDHDPHLDVFDALMNTLDQLDHADDPLVQVVAFQIALLTEVGLLPRFDGCVICSRESDLIYFSSHQGGFVCRHCEPGQVEKRLVSDNTRRTLAEANPVPQEQSTVPNFAGATGAFTLLNYHISHLMGREPRMAAKIVSPYRQRIVD